MLFVIELERRFVQPVGVTANPNDAWVTQVARNFTTTSKRPARSGDS